MQRNVVIMQRGVILQNNLLGSRMAESNVIGGGEGMRAMERGEQNGKY